jgi:hypothetical protein
VYLCLADISHEELLAKFRERNVTLLVLSPELYHVWGKRMEENWIAAMRWYLHDTQDRVRETPVLSRRAAT